MLVAFVLWLVARLMVGWWLLGLMIFYDSNVMCSLLKHYGASYRNRSPFKSWGKSMCSMFISTKKCHCYLHFEQIETLSYVMSLQARGILVNFPLFFRGQLKLLRLGFVGSLSTFLPKDSCLGARQETSHQWPCTFGWGKLLEDNPRLFFFHANWCYII